MSWTERLTQTLVFQANLVQEFEQLQERWYEWLIKLLKILLISILQGSGLSEKYFKQYIKETLNLFSRQSMNVMGDICKFLPLVTHTRKQQNKNPLITSGYSYKPNDKLIIFAVRNPWSKGTQK